MSELQARGSNHRLHDRLDAIVELLQSFDEKPLLLTVQSQLRGQLDELHPADIALILESPPLDDRIAVWQLVRADRDGDILLEVSAAARDSLIADMDSLQILAAVEPLDADGLAALVEDLPGAVLPRLMASLDSQQCEQVQSAMSCEDDQLAALMDFERVTIREDVSLEVAFRNLRRFDELPAQTRQPAQRRAAAAPVVGESVRKDDQCRDGAGREYLSSHRCCVDLGFSTQPLGLPSIVLV